MKELNLQLQHLEKGYLRPVLMDINLCLQNYDYISVIGQSGSGKSTLLNILGLIEDYDGGTYTLNGVRIRKGIDYAKLRREAIGFIFQSYNLIPTLSCKENIFLPTLYNRKAGIRSFDELVSQLKLEPLLPQRVNTLSGGEKQRVAIARALILDPCLLLADEPTGNLDPENRDIITELLRTENEKGCGVILITHDHEVAQTAKTIYRLEGGTLHAT